MLLNILNICIYKSIFRIKNKRLWPQRLEPGSSPNSGPYPAAGGDLAWGVMGNICARRAQAQESPKQDEDEDSHMFDKDDDDDFQPGSMSPQTPVPSWGRSMQRGRELLAANGGKPSYPSGEWEVFF